MFHQICCPGRRLEHLSPGLGSFNAKQIIVTDLISFT